MNVDSWRLLFTFEEKNVFRRKLNLYYSLVGIILEFKIKKENKFIFPKLRQISKGKFILFRFFLILKPSADYGDQKRKAQK